MSSPIEPIITTPTDHVSLTVVRKSDGQSITFVLGEKTHVHDLKTVLRLRLKPQFEQGCRLIFREKVLKGRHSLKHYGIKKGVNDQILSSRINFLGRLSPPLHVRLSLVDDTKEWHSSSSSSEDDQGR